MQGIFTYIPETNHVPREYSVAAILSLLCMVSISLVPALALLYFHVSTTPATPYEQNIHITRIYKINAIQDTNTIIILILIIQHYYDIIL